MPLPLTVSCFSITSVLSWHILWRVGWKFGWGGGRRGCAADYGTVHAITHQAGWSHTRQTVGIDVFGFAIGSSCLSVHHTRQSVTAGFADIVDLCHKVITLSVCIQYTPWLSQACQFYAIAAYFACCHISRNILAKCVYRIFFSA